MKLLFTLLLIFATSTSYAQNNDDDRWAFIGESKEKEKYYIDTKSRFEKDDLLGQKEVWIKTIAPSKKVYKNGKYVTYNNTTTLTLFAFNCDRRQIAIKQEIIYDANKKLVQSWDASYEEFTKVVPGSVGEMILEEACLIH